VNGVPDYPDHPELLLRERAWLRALARQLVRLLDQVFAED